MTTELFYGWIANHFVFNILPPRPVVLLVDGHSTHIDIEISKFCNKNGILLYCLPAHSSHITQPLDVGFYGPLKQAWKKAVSEYSCNNIGKSITKQTFAEVFKVAWENTVKVSTIVSSFRSAGIFPVDFSAIRPEKLAPATIYTTVPAQTVVECGCVSKVSKVSPVPAGTKPEPITNVKAGEVALEVFESTLDKGTREKFTVRYEEGYDLDNDELYCVWLKLKGLSIDKKPNPEGALRNKLELPARQLRSSARHAERGTRVKAAPKRKNQSKKEQPNTTEPVKRVTELKVPTPLVSERPQKSEAVSSWGDILIYPKQIPHKKTRAGTSGFPTHISSDQMIKYLKEKEDKK